MSKQIRPSVTNPTIATVYNEISNGLLVLAPEFQRRFVWTQPHQEEFLDTVLRGFPFPEIYVSAGEIDLEAMKTVRNVIDGQQRLTTIRNYIEDRFEKPLNLVSSYSELSDDQKKSFLSYEVVIRDLGKIDDDTIREIFRRINLTKFKLDTVEIHNAIYDGSFIQVAKSILDETDISVFGVFKESEFSRMGDLHFVLLVLSTLEIGGYFSQDKEVEPMIEKFNEEYPNAIEQKNRLLGALSTASGLGLAPDSMWFRKSNFYTMISEFAFHLDALPHDIFDRLQYLEESVMANKQNTSSEFGRYYSYMYQGTNNRSARVVRSELFRKYCFQLNAESRSS
ncbi:DUF262 domain-containing protein [Planktotalea sp.]|uniref:DUF262 domain-containing protein n=1 Tax=Planktotalea sp. TaxID=2029877 RepID=UPI00329A7BA4